MAKVLAPSPPLGAASLVPRPPGLPGHLAGSPPLSLVLSRFICERGWSWNLPEGVVRIRLHSEEGEALGTVPALRRASCHSHPSAPSQSGGREASHEGAQESSQPPWEVEWSGLLLKETLEIRDFSEAEKSHRDPRLI